MKLLQRIAPPIAFAVLATSASAQLGTYTQANLGYPVPLPVESTLPVDGFRSYASIQTRLSDLALGSDMLTRHNLGTTLEGRTIHTFVLTSPDDAGPDGMPKTGAMVNGTIHAREWASPEISTRLLETLLEGHGTDPIATYLVDQNRIVVTPVLNVDGFLQTQRWPNQYWGQNDGRMRRKNMLNADQELILTTADNNNGVDLNRNFTQGWGNASGSPTSQIYYGSGPLSEPESQALASAINLFDQPTQLRAYFDMHGAIPLLYAVLSNRPRADAVANSMAVRMRDTYRARNGVPFSYSIDIVLPSQTIGATDEYFGVTYKIPSFTIEYPTPRYRVSGSGPTFILPDDEVAEVVDENLFAMKLAMMMGSGPPILEEVIVWREVEGGDPIIDRHSRWNPLPGSPPGREFAVVAEGDLLPGTEYRITLRFNKPMRWLNEQATISHWPGQSLPLQPTVGLTGTLAPTISPLAGGWALAVDATSPAASARYSLDSWVGTFTVPEEASDGTEWTLTAAAVDLAGLGLDTNPATWVDWNEGFTNYEGSASVTVFGGTDQNHTLLIGSEQPSSSLTGWFLY